MEHANAGTRLLIALARFGAQRVPAFALRWADIRQDEGVVIVPDQKRKLRRQVPITSVLRNELARVANGSTPEPEAKVVTRSRFNLHKDVKRALERAGVPGWKRPFQNLRASCETDIREHAPSHIASMIVGHCGNRCTPARRGRVSRGRSGGKGWDTKSPVDPVVAGSSLVRLASMPCKYKLYLFRSAGRNRPIRPLRPDCVLGPVPDLNPVVCG